MVKIGTQTGSFSYAKYQLRRSILENALKSNYSTEDYEAALKYFGGCAFCGTEQAPRRDHLIPVVQCGDFTRHNVVPACQKCDDSKGQREYREWMRNSDSERSLKTRGFTDEHIEKRIHLIENWQAGYAALTDVELFGEDYVQYKDILARMENLRQEARDMTRRVRTRNGDQSVENTTFVSQASHNSVTIADRIRAFVINHYINPAFERGAKTVTVRSGDVHIQLQLRAQHANVCQALKGDILLRSANITSKSFTGTPAGANAYFTYQL